MELNRLYIIGNGFDLAHGLPTSYSDFLDYYWLTTYERFESENGHFFTSYKDEFITVRPTQNNVQTRIPTSSNPSLTSLRATFGIKVIFNNKLFGRINESHQNNWVDIENDYYNALLEILDQSSVRNRYYKASDLNKDFNDIIKSVHAYLIEIEQDIDLKQTPKFKASKKQIPIAFSTRYTLKDLSNKTIQEKINSEFNQSKDALIKEENFLSAKEQRLKGFFLINTI